MANFSRIPQSVWTRQSITTGAKTVGTPYDIFTIKAGDSGVTLNDTNLKTPSRVPYPIVTIYGVQVEIYNDANLGKLNALDMNAARQNVSLTIRKNTVIRLQEMVHNIPAGNDVTGSISTGVATTTIINGTNGVPSATNMFMLKEPEIFTTNDRLEGQLRIEAAWTVATAYKYRVTLIGFVDQAQGVVA